MVSLFFSHKLISALFVYIAVGVFVVWFFDEIRRVVDEQTASPGEGRVQGGAFVIFKCFAAIAAVTLWPFVLRNRLNEAKAEGRSSRRQKQRKSAPASSKDWSLGQTLLGDFVVERILGEGGMGKVYLVKSETTSMRFAIKRAKGMGDQERQTFLAELQTWIDLPDHSNLVACRFFRTIDDEIIIFAEYVEGGSLRNWIDSRKLYEGGRQKTLERLLDTAIQFAWSLHCVHQLGLVHQDVKPANVMMELRQTLRPRLTDYGLARGRRIAVQHDPIKAATTILVSSRGFTPAYCSPEQADGRKLDQRTDIWSWGLSVLEMFQGEVFWPSGRVAREALLAFAEHNGEHQHIPPMPAQLVELLRECFDEDPLQRCQSFESIVQVLKCIYHTALGVAYNQPLDTIDPRVVEPGRDYRTHEGLSWRDPRTWIESALRVEGRAPSEVASIIPLNASSRRGQLAADVVGYDEARRMYERLVQNGRKGLIYDLSVLCANAACLHEAIDDFSGAAALYDRCIELLHGLIRTRGRREFIDFFVSVYEQKAKLLMKLGDNRMAIRMFDAAMEVQRAAACETPANAQLDNYSICANKGVAFGKLGDHRGAIVWYDRAIQVLERLIYSNGRRELAADLAGLYLNKANSVATLGDQRAALDLYDKAIKLREKLVLDEGRIDQAQGLAALYTNKAVILDRLGDIATALALYDRAIDTLQHVVTAEGKVEFANDLAGLYMNKGIAVGEHGDKSTAISLYDRAIEIREWLVNTEGRRELASSLAKVYVNKANALIEFRDLETGLSLYKRAIELLERLIRTDGRRELEPELAQIYSNMANACMRIGDNRRAIEPYERAIKILHSLISVGGDDELIKNLAILYRNQGNALKNLGETRSAIGLYDHAIQTLSRLNSADTPYDLAENIAERRRQASTDNYKQEKHELTEQLTEALASEFFGNTIPVDILYAATDEIIIPAHRKLSRTVLRLLARAHDRFEIADVAIRTKICAIIEPYKKKFAELERQYSEAGATSTKAANKVLLRHQTFVKASEWGSDETCTLSRST